MNGHIHPHVVSVTCHCQECRPLERRCDCEGCRKLRGRQSLQDLALGDPILFCTTCELNTPSGWVPVNKVHMQGSTVSLFNNDELVCELYGGARVIAGEMFGHFSVQGRELRLNPGRTR